MQLPHCINKCWCRVAIAEILADRKCRLDSLPQLITSHESVHFSWIMEMILFLNCFIQKSKVSQISYSCHYNFKHDPSQTKHT